MLKFVLTNYHIHSNTNFTIHALFFPSLTVSPCLPLSVGWLWAAHTFAYSLHTAARSIVVVDVVALRAVHALFYQSHISERSAPAYAVH